MTIPCMFKRPDGTYPAPHKEVFDALGLDYPEDSDPNVVWDLEEGEMPSGWTRITWDDVKSEHPPLPPYDPAMPKHWLTIWDRCPLDENGNHRTDVEWNAAMGAWEG